MHQRMPLRRAYLCHHRIADMERPGLGTIIRIFGGRKSSLNSLSIGVAINGFDSKRMVLVRLMILSLYALTGNTLFDRSSARLTRTMSSTKLAGIGCCVLRDNRDTGPRC